MHAGGNGEKRKDMTPYKDSFISDDWSQAQRCNVSGIWLAPSRAPPRAAPGYVVTYTRVHPLSRTLVVAPWLHAFCKCWRWMGCIPMIRGGRRALQRDLSGQRGTQGVQTQRGIQKCVPRHRCRACSRSVDTAAHLVGTEAYCMSILPRCMYIFGGVCTRTCTYCRMYVRIQTRVHTGLKCEVDALLEENLCIVCMGPEQDTRNECV